MSPAQNLTVTCAVLEKLQSQNNTIQLVAAIFAIAYGIPLIFALWLQWKSFIVAKGHTDLESQRIESTDTPDDAEARAIPDDGNHHNRQIAQGRDEGNVASKGRPEDATSGDITSTDAKPTASDLESTARPFADASKFEV
ncbi:MAG: hypothetical protein Q9218_002124 [Villophora microphyllina]